MRMEQGSRVMERGSRVMEQGSRVNGDVSIMVMTQEWSDGRGVVSAIHMVRGGAKVDMTTGTEVTTIVTRCTVAMGQDAVGETKGGTSLCVTWGDKLIDRWEAVMR